MKSEHAFQAEIADLKSEVEALKTRLTEDETVIASLQAWTLYSLGILLRHLHDPNEMDRDQASHAIEAVFDRMYGTLKQGYRGAGELRQTKDGFDRLYMCSQEISNMWKLMREIEFSEKPDVRGTKLINLGYDTIQRLDPLNQAMIPVETLSERRLREQASNLVHQIRSRRSE
jgi:hypothetical protein